MFYILSNDFCLLVYNMQVLEGSEATLDGILSDLDKVTAATLSKVIRGISS